MPDSQSLARLPCPIHDDDSGRRRAENSATRWSRCSAQRVDHNLCYRLTSTASYIAAHQCSALVLTKKRRRRGRLARHLHHHRPGPRPTHPTQRLIVAHLDIPIPWPETRQEAWLQRRRALQPIFTKQHVCEFGGHMAQAAHTVADSWIEGTEVDLDTECRRLTLRALGRSVLGLDLDAHSDAIAEPLRVAVEYITDRALRPVSPPRWLPTPARRRARTASDTLHRLADEILQACRADPTRDAPLVHSASLQNRRPLRHPVLRRRDRADPQRLPWPSPRGQQPRPARAHRRLRRRPRHRRRKSSTRRHRRNRSGLNPIHVASTTIPSSRRTPSPRPPRPRSPHRAGPFSCPDPRQPR
jgi:hypothetical protein